MTWAPHPRPLPQAVPNSFAEWMNATDYDFVITHPEGYELAPQFVGNAKVEYDQMKLSKEQTLYTPRTGLPIQRQLRPDIKQRP